MLSCVSSQYLATHTEGSFPWAFDKRSHGLLTAILNSFFMGGIIFGIAAAKMAFRQQNVFSENCVCGTFCNAHKIVCGLTLSSEGDLDFNSKPFIRTMTDLRNYLR